MLHEHIESGLSEEDLLMKVRERVPLGISGPAEMSTGLEQVYRTHSAGQSFDILFSLLCWRASFNAPSIVSLVLSCENMLSLRAEELAVQQH